MKFAPGNLQLGTAAYSAVEGDPTGGLSSYSISDEFKVWSKGLQPQEAPSCWWERDQSVINIWLHGCDAGWTTRVAAGRTDQKDLWYPGTHVAGRLHGTLFSLCPSSCALVYTPHAALPLLAGMHVSLLSRTMPVALTRQSINLCGETRHIMVVSKDYSVGVGRMSSRTGRRIYNPFSGTLVLKPEPRGPLQCH